MKADRPTRPSLSIAAAWDEANAFLRAELPLLAPVALAFVALPQGLTDILSPDQGTMDLGMPTLLLKLASLLIQLYGAIAISLLALKPGLSVAEALRAALRRMPSMLGVLGLTSLAVFLLLLPILSSVAGAGFGRMPVAGVPAFYASVLMLFAAWAFVPTLFTGIVAAAEACGPVHVLRRSFAIVRGNWWRITAFVVLFFGFGLVVLIAFTAGVGSLVLMLGKLIDEVAAARAIALLLGSVVAAGLTMWMQVVLSRIYLRLVG